MRGSNQQNQSQLLYGPRRKLTRSAPKLSWSTEADPAQVRTILKYLVQDLDSGAWPLLSQRIEDVHEHIKGYVITSEATTDSCIDQIKKAGIVLYSQDQVYSPLWLENDLQDHVNIVEHALLLCPKTE